MLALKRFPYIFTKKSLRLPVLAQKPLHNQQKISFHTCLKTPKTFHIFQEISFCTCLETSLHTWEGLSHHKFEEVCIPPYYREVYFQISRRACLQISQALRSRYKKKLLSRGLLSTRYAKQRPFNKRRYSQCQQSILNQH